MASTITQLILANDSQAIIADSKTEKTLYSKDYNFIFRKKDGFFIRYGNSINSDGDLNLGLPEILDIEISTICHGVNGKVCSFCYKANTPKGEHMIFDTFKQIADKMPKSLMQTAFGIGDLPNSTYNNSTIGNPDMWRMMEHCREIGIVPNLTINGEGLTEEIVDKLIQLVGAVAVSNYDTNLTYNAVQLLTSKGLKQTNIHNFLCEESFEKSMQLMQDYKTDERLKNLNAIVFLSLKKKGRAEKGFTQLSQEKFNILVDYALNNEIPIGFDSCSSFKFYEAIKDKPNFKSMWDSVEPCESTLYSTYINSEAKFFPCSFYEGVEDWKEGIDVLEAENFLRDVWWNDKTNKFRCSNIRCREDKRCCIHYDI